MPFDSSQSVGRTGCLAAANSPRSYVDTDTRVLIQTSRKKTSERKQMMPNQKIDTLAKPQKVSFYDELKRPWKKI